MRPTVSEIQGIQRDLGRNAHCISGLNLDNLAKLLWMFKNINEQVFEFASKNIFYINLGQTNGILHAYNPKIIEAITINPRDELFRESFIVFITSKAPKRLILHEIAHAWLGHKNWYLIREDDEEQEKRVNEQVDYWLKQADKKGIRFFG
jgi:hypothetical protein